MVAVAGGFSRMRRTDRILEAVRIAIEKRKSSLNNEVDVRSVSVVVKMKNGSDIPRAVLVSVETEDELKES